MIPERLTCLLCPAAASSRSRGRGRRRSPRPRVRKGVFAVEEVLHPMRNLATSVPVRGPRTMVSVRLSAPVPRDRIFPVLAAISRLRPEAPVRRGQVLIADVLGTGVDVIATRTQDGVKPTFYAEMRKK